MIHKNFGGLLPPRQEGSAEDTKIITQTITSIERMEAPWRPSCCMRRPAS